MRINLRAISESCEEIGVCIEHHGPDTDRVERIQRILSLGDSPWIKCNFGCA